MKSHVSMEQKLCVVCGKPYDSGAILLDCNLKESMEKHTITGFGMCEEHEKLTNDGYVHLVGINHNKSEVLPSGNVNPNGAYRTGALAHIKKHVFTNMFNMSIPRNGVVFVDPEIINLLSKQPHKQV